MRVLESAKQFGLLLTLINFGHDNIRRFCDRPFDSWWEMNDVLVENYNNCVGVDDDVYHLGDFALMSKDKTLEMLNRLNGRKHFLAGNHDKSLFKRDSDFNIMIREEVVPHVKWIKDYHEITIQDPSAQRKKQMIVLGHYAMRVWNKSHWKSFHLYGHSHGTLLDDPNSLSIDVGVDAIAKRYSVKGVIDPADYRPICYEEIKVIMGNKQFPSVDHHSDRL